MLQWLLAWPNFMVEKEIAAFEAKLVADALAAEMMAEIEREMALAAFQQKLAG